MAERSQDLKQINQERRKGSKAYSEKQKRKSSALINLRLWVKLDALGDACGLGIFRRGMLNLLKIVVYYSMLPFSEKGTLRHREVTYFRGLHSAQEC